MDLSISKRVARTLLQDLKEEIDEIIDWKIESIKEAERDDKALSQEPCDDAISRILKRMWNCRGKHTTSIDKVAMEQIIRDELPSVTQKSKSGHWIKKEDDTCWWYACSECEQEPLKNRWNDDDVLSAFCPNCGAKMESEDKE